jgi:NAD(P)-dependent dehydrogenase (short-subunit alcohol dehydrogenase family)
MARIIVVTGAGDGLGRALARAAVARGDIVAGLGRTAATLQETGAGLPAERYGWHVADVADWAQVERAVAAILECHGRIDALFANAAVYPRSSLLDHAPADWMHVQAINVGGVLHACRAVLPDMMARGSGRIVVLGSFADVSPIPNTSAYAVSKGALHPLVKAIANELGDAYPDLLVNEWVPGELATGMGKPEGIAPAQAARWGMDMLDLPAGGPTGRLFLHDKLFPPPPSLKRRILNRLLGRR